VHAYARVAADVIVCQRALRSTANQRVGLACTAVIAVYAKHTETSTLLAINDARRGFRGKALLPELHLVGLVLMSKSAAVPLTTQRHGWVWFKSMKPGALGTYVGCPTQNQMHVHLSQGP
jgi:hypothetical protein